MSHHTQRIAATALVLGTSMMLSGCLAISAAQTAGSVVSGTTKATVFTAKTAGRAAGAVIPGGGDSKDDDRRGKDMDDDGIDRDDR